jgi:hypothetical protein
MNEKIFHGFDIFGEKTHVRNPPMSAFRARSLRHNAQLESWLPDDSAGRLGRR